MKAKVNRKCHVSFFLLGRRRLALTSKVFFILNFLSDPESESESEQPHHDSAPLVVSLNKKDNGVFIEQQIMSGLQDILHTGSRNDTIRLSWMT